MRHLLLGVGFVVLWVTTASAQQPLLVGDRLRATYLPDPSNSERKGTVTGEYVGLGPSALRLSMLPGGQQVQEVDLDEMLRLERSRPRTVGEGAGRGALWGALAGTLVGLGIIAQCSSDDFFQCDGSAFLVGPAIFGGIGAGAGAVIGMAARGTKWEEIPVPEVR
ncbi:MAG TPA: hypothetical protein VJP59_10215 [Gemmatimonadota bacterium]|nr:hypothetical protein [Gemmatimonadota bacterium]